MCDGNLGSLILAVYVSLILETTQLKLIKPVCEIKLINIFYAEECNKIKNRGCCQYLLQALLETDPEREYEMFKVKFL